MKRNYLMFGVLLLVAGSLSSCSIVENYLTKKLGVEQVFYEPTMTKYVEARKGIAVKDLKIPYLPTKEGYTFDSWIQINPKGIVEDYSKIDSKDYNESFNDNRDWLAQIYEEIYFSDELYHPNYNNDERPTSYISEIYRNTLLVPQFKINNPVKLKIEICDKDTKDETGDYSRGELSIFHHCWVDHTTGSYVNFKYSTYSYELEASCYDDIVFDFDHDYTFYGNPVEPYLTINSSTEIDLKDLGEYTLSKDFLNTNEVTIAVDFR